MTLPTMTVTVGPLSCVFGNENTAMGLKLHFHTAQVYLEYRAEIGNHGYPSFHETNQALRDYLRHLTSQPFANATNEDVCQRLFTAFSEFHHDSWDRYGGLYHLTALHLDVVGVVDSIGHDDGTTRYTYRWEQ